MNYTQVVLGGRALRELRGVEPILMDVLEECRRVWPRPTMIVSSIYRTGSEESAISASVGKKTSGIHNTKPHRAVDITARNVPGTVAQKWEACGRVAKAVNRKFIYNPRSPSLRVAVAAPHGTGPHLHLQVRPGQQTRIRRDSV